MEVEPYPWRQLPRADRRASAWVAAIAGWGGARVAAWSRHGLALATPAGTVEVRVAGFGVAAGVELTQRLADPSSASAVVRARGGAIHVVASGALTRMLAQAILGGPEELRAPRPPTPAERGVLAYAIAAALEQLGADGDVEASELAGPLVAKELGAAGVIELVVDGAAAGWAAIVAPPPLWRAGPRRPLVELAAGVAWLDEPVVPIAVALGTAGLSLAQVAALAPRDVLVADRAPAGVALAVGRGYVAAALAPDGASVTVRGSYQRGPAMDETLGDDAMIEVAVVAGTLTASPRQLLELAPGQVLALGTPLGASVELRVGRRVVARGELVDVDGELGVRVIAVEAR